jgi:hypothetical protein
METLKKSKYVWDTDQLEIKVEQRKTKVCDEDNDGFREYDIEFWATLKLKHWYGGFRTSNGLVSGNKLEFYEKLESVPLEKGYISEGLRDKKELFLDGVHRSLYNTWIELEKSENFLLVIGMVDLFKDASK